MAPESALSKVLGAVCLNMTAAFATDSSPAVGRLNDGHDRAPEIRFRTLSIYFRLLIGLNSALYTDLR